MNIMDDFFHRIDSTLTVPQILQLVTDTFHLGVIRRHAPIFTGYQECNIDFHTSQGRFVIKIFSREKTRQRIDEVIWGYTHLKKLGVPLPRLIPNGDGHHLLVIPGEKRSSYLCIFEYFEGKPLTQTPVTDADLIALTQALATIHKTPKVIGRYFDTLGIMNVPEEFEKKNDAFFTEELSLIKPVISKLQHIDIASFHHSIIHGTMEKENILKNSGGQLCLLDLGCMDYNASILDIATFIANFTLYLTEEKRTHVIELILTTYQQSRQLSRGEIAALPTFIRAQFVAYIIGMTYHMRKDHDMSKQNQTWLDRGWDGLKAYQKITSLV